MPNISRINRITKNLSTFLAPRQLESIAWSTNKINIWHGSIRSGKTYASVFRFVLECARGPAGQFAILTRTYDTFKRNIIPILDLLIGPDYSYSHGKRELYIYDRLCHVIGCDDERAEYKIRGATFAGAYVDEITTIPESVYQMLLSRLSVAGSKLFGTTNPDNPHHWLKAKIDHDSDVTAFHFTLDDNTFLPEETRAFYRREYKGLWYRRFIEGAWVAAQGLVYEAFDESVNVINTYPRAQYYIIGIDYGTHNPTAAVCIGVNLSGFPNTWVEKEYYWDSQIKQKQKADVELAEDISAFVRGLPVVAIYLDPSALSFRQELIRQGVSKLCEADNDVLQGLSFVATQFAVGKLKVYEGCVNLRKEILSYVWDEKSLNIGVDKPKKQHDHLCDALRYGVYTHFKGNSDPDAGNKMREAARRAHGDQSALPPIFRDSNENRYF